LRAVSRTELISNARPSISREWGFLGAAGAYLAACFFLGGATRSGFAADAALQLLAVPLLLIGLWQLRECPPRFSWPLAFCLSVVLVPLLQLIPLPPQLWTALPLRGFVVQSLTLAEQDIGWRPLSLTPHATWLSLASLIPPIAVFVATLLLSWRDRQRLVLLLLGLGIVGGFGGLMQVAQGSGGTSIGLGTPGEATGFFANRNHFAALLYVLLLFAGVFAIDSAKSLAPGSVRSWETRALIVVVLSFTILVALLAAQMMARSRAGIGLTIVAFLGIAALASSDERGASGVGAKRLVGGAVALVLLFATQFALFRVMERFAADPLADARLTFARNTWDAALAFMPFGSGLGSFVPVYQAFEKPRDALLDTFANRAHNDVLEIWLETGMIGLVLMALFAAWLLLKLWQVWWREESGARPVDQLLRRAASLSIVLLCAHSLVDYPLRTTALMAVFAFACGLLVEPLGLRNRHAAREDEDARDHVSSPTDAHAATGGDVRARPTPEPGTVSPQRWSWPDETPGPEPRAPEPASAEPSKGSAPQKGGQEAVPAQRWGIDKQWPEAWRKPQGREPGKKTTDKD